MFARSLNSFRTAAFRSPLRTMGAQFVSPLSQATARRQFATGASQFGFRFGANSFNFGASASKKTGLALGLLGVSATYMVNHNPIRLDAAYANQLPPAPDGYTYVKVPSGPQYDGAFNGKLNYKELSLGSVFGTLAGLIAGQMSTFIAFAGLAFYLTFQYLYSKGVIQVPFTKVIKVGSEYIDVRKMVFENPSFNLTFVLTFLIAAYNS